MQQFKWDIFGHPPYSPDLAPSDYHFFPALKKQFGGRKFETTDEIEEAVNEYLKNLDARHFEVGVEKLICRYEKCLERCGDYVEK